MKRIRFVLLAAVLLAAITIPAFGANENPNKGSLLVITGEVTDVPIDCNGWGACFYIKDYWDNEPLINVSEDARCVEKTIDEETGEVINQKIDCTDIAAGDFVSVQYEEQYIALRVNVDADLIHFMEPAE